MPRIPSANQDLARLDTPTDKPGYSHPATKRRGAIPLAFQITSPFNRNRVLLPHALVMHVNPASFNETHSHKKETIQTRGGFVEQHWGDELSEISCDGSTGSFMNIFTGTSSVLRQRTIAWDRYRDLYDLYRNNGSVYDPFGNIVLQGNVMLMYDKGVYIGFFHSFDVEETDDAPFSFNISWSFKVERTLMQLPSVATKEQRADGRILQFVSAPGFQSQNQSRVGPLDNPTNAALPPPASSVLQNPPPRSTTFVSNAAATDVANAFRAPPPILTDDQIAAKTEQLYQESQAADRIGRFETSLPFGKTDPTQPTFKPTKEPPLSAATSRILKKK